MKTRAKCDGSLRKAALLSMMSAMIESMKLILKWGSIAMAISAMAAVGCRSRREDDRGSGESLFAAMEKEHPDIKKRIDDVYALKLEGKNGDALALLRGIEPDIVKHYGQESEVYASLLDDEATCYVRGGKYDTADKLYARAASILTKLSLTKTRLFAGIHRRRLTIAALKKAGVKCREPLSPSPTKDAAAGALDSGTAAPPYFPSLASLHSAFYKMRQEMDGCVAKMPKSIPIWNVVTGDGRVVLSDVKSTALSEAQAACLEEKLEKAALIYREKLPRFSACYRNFTFPVAFRE